LVRIYAKYHICHDEHTSADVLSFLPMVELNSLDEMCLYPTLLYVMDQSQQLEIVIQCIGL